ncbi:MAG: hypothetical protein ACR2FG_08275, partial [Marmoricola sp.]
MFGLALLIPVTLVRGAESAAPPLLLVIVLAAVMNVASLMDRFREDLLAMLEGALVAVIAVGSDPGGLNVLPYLVVPMLLGGFSGRLQGLMRVLMAEVLASALLWWPVRGTPTLSTTRELLIWLVAGVALGGLGIALQRRFGGDTDAASYRDAIGLIQQLDALSGKLTGGLDPVTLAEQLMAEAEVQLPVQQAAVFTRSPSGAVSPLRHSTFSAPNRFGGLDDFVENCWRSDRPLLRGLTAGVPLRTGSRTVGVLVLDLSHNSD